MHAPKTSSIARWFVPGDIDGFFGLFFSGLPDLLLIGALCPLCGLPQQLVTRTILPGIACCLLGGNLFYAWQAHRLALRTGRDDVTAIPFGVNAPTIFAYIFLIMLPVYQRTKDPTLAWHMGIFACLVSGVIQCVGAFCTDWLRRTTPPAAILAPLAGVAIGFLSLSFIVQIFEQPELALLPTVIIMVAYGARLRLPFRLPAAGFAMIIGMALFWILRALHVGDLPVMSPMTSPTFSPPHVVNVFAILAQPESWQFISIILPMALIDTIGSLMILESIRLSGDDYSTTPSLLANGLATFGAAFLGSAFPTTLYFGHMAHKAVGARIGYSILNGAAVMLIALTGVMSALLHFIPFQVVAIVIVWFGLAMVGQAFQEVPKIHGVAVAFGLVPLLCSWGLQQISSGLDQVGSSLYLCSLVTGGALPIKGLVVLSQGAILISMIWTAALAYIIDQRFLLAAAWLSAGAIASCLGLIHGYELTSQGIVSHLGLFVAPHFAVSYLLVAAFLIGCHFYRGPGARRGLDAVELVS
jgi:AGZA family xanthine/uracil permease-like MFS transporter